jgi:hypothetical protein
MNKITIVEADRIVSILNETLEKLSILNHIPLEPDSDLTDTIEVGAVVG